MVVKNFFLEYFVFFPLYVIPPILNVLRWLVATLSLRMSGFDPMPIQNGFMVNTASLGLSFHGIFTLPL